MRNMLAFLAASVLALAGLGWYLGWYEVKTEPSLSGHEKVNIDINSAKVIEDVHKGKHMVEEMKKHAEEQAEPHPAQTQE